MSKSLSDPKIMVVVALIIGLLAGYVFHSAILSKPRLDELTQTVNQQAEMINNLENQLDELQDDYDTLQTQYNQLEENSIPLSQYNQLQQQNEEQGTQIETLQGVVENLETIVNALTQENQNLENELNLLKTRFYSAYNPLFVAFTLDGLDVNLTVTTDIYPQNSPISGEVTIRHTNGVPFSGDFKLTLTKVYLGAGTPSEYYQIQGTRNYTWVTPFVLGAGSYRLSLSEVRDSQGNVVLNSNQLRPYAIYVFQG